MFFRLSSWVLILLVVVVVVGGAALGYRMGRHVRHRAAHFRDPVVAVQGALLGFVGLVLAFGLSLAVGRYEARRAATVAETNTIETTYLRAQTLAEPVRADSLERLIRYTDTRIRLSSTVPTSARADDVIEDGALLERQLWGLAGQALEAAPRDSVPRLYTESLNEMFDAGTARVGALNNRVPDTVLALEVFGAAAALAFLGTHLGILGRGVVPVLLAASLVSFMLLVEFDLDRPARGLIRIPSTALTTLRSSMDLPPAATGPDGP
jgi:hypothetical protein